MFYYCFVSITVNIKSFTPLKFIRPILKQISNTLAIKVEENYLKIKM